MRFLAWIPSAGDTRTWEHFFIRWPFYVLGGEILETSVRLVSIALAFSIARPLDVQVASIFTLHAMASESS